MKSASKVIIGLGSNSGNRLDYLNMAIERIEQSVGNITSVSSVYETESWGYTDADYLNQVVVATTHHDPDSTLKKCLEIELSLGRQRKTANYESRTIDIDILFFNNEIIESDTLKIPHPEISNRMFVLEPLTEILPQFVHPVIKKTMVALRNECPDNSKVIRIP